MLDIFITDKDAAATPVWLIRTGEAEAWCATHAGPGAAWVATSGFKGEAGKVLLLPDGSGGLAGVLLGLGDGADPFVAGALPASLPAGDYRLAGEMHGDVSKAVFAFALGTYRFTRYSGKAREWPRLVLPKGVDGEEVSRLARATFLARDLINTPAGDMSPADLAAAAKEVAAAHEASFSTIEGGDLLTENYPMIHAVGRAAAVAPRLIDMRWGREGAPKVTLVGKGVCFDTGGLDLKPSSAMLLMKKDMGGAAHAIALAKLVMHHNLPVRLHLLVPAVENAISGNALRPGDIVKSRKGLTVEITNTDAEGRLILADALDRASEENPELLIDFATLTGAARVALGPDYPALMTRRDETAEALISAGKAHDDEPWRLPLPGIYREWLDSPLADCINAPTNGFAGASVAGLFLDQFVGEDIDWAHFDTYAWRPTARPGRPKGGEAYGLRASWHMLRERFGA